MFGWLSESKMNLFCKLNSWEVCWLTFLSYAGFQAIEGTQIILAILRLSENVILQMYVSISNIWYFTAKSLAKQTNSVSQFLIIILFIFIKIIIQWSQRHNKIFCYVRFSIFLHSLQVFLTKQCRRQRLVLVHRKKYSIHRHFILKQAKNLWFTVA